MSNIPLSIKSKIGRNLHNQPNHPIEIIKNLIFKYFEDYHKFDNLDPIVSTEHNFDLLLIPKEHPSRSKSDTYYVDDNNVLRTHTSAHQNELLKKGYEKFLVCGDVYRKDEIDHKHYPIFHQVEGVCLTDQDPLEHLKSELSGLIKYLFPNCEYRFNNDYFPFVEPGLEVEIKFNNAWIEVLGCGVIHNKILDNLNINKKGFAFGLGLDRLAMILFDIPDIRLFWTDDPRFLSQFTNSNIIKFKPYPTLKSITKDISFWINKDEVVSLDTTFNWLNINDFYETIREVSNDTIKSVSVLDKFFHPKKLLYSMTFRLEIEPENYNESNPSKLETYANDVIKNITTLLIKKNYQLR